MHSNTERWSVVGKTLKITNTIHVRPVPFKKDDLHNFNISDVEREMTELGLKPKDLVKLLDIDKSSMSIILNEGRAMTKPHKAMFFYLFKSLKHNKTTSVARY